jgi:hypothetical protein
MVRERRWLCEKAVACHWHATEEEVDSHQHRSARQIAHVEGREEVVGSVPLVSLEVCKLRAATSLYSYKCIVQFTAGCR